MYAVLNDERQCRIESVSDGAQRYCVLSVLYTP
jgi:hypothetical protein